MKIINLILILIINVTSDARGVEKVPVPGWVNQINSTNEKIAEGNGGYQYLLIDAQNNLLNQTIFRHYAVKILNTDGVQSMSDIDVDFDPNYQKLQFHKVQIIRKGKIINKLNESKVELVQKETSRERYMYDGSLSAIINLTDVRADDIIEYSYSIIGFNPVNKGNYTNTFYQQFSSPVNRIYNRVVTDENKNIQYKLYSEATEPTVKRLNNTVEYIWDIETLEVVMYDNNVPSWFDAQKRVTVTTFNRWNEIVEWALPLYNYNPEDIKQIKNSLEVSSNGEEKILELIRFVQDEIRYLGFEEGIGAYKPNNPLKVYKQRYGDCKDKSLLLVALLRSEGITANPLLVNTELGYLVEDLLPGINAFDHCVVNFNYEGKEYFIDPTSSNQGGNLDNLSFPGYSKGLIIRKGETGLSDLSTPIISSTKINEIITVDSIGGDAGMKVITEYTGAKADGMRGYFKNNSKDQILKGYLNFYSSLYPHIESAGEIRIVDNDRNEGNKLIIEEFYNIRKFWVDTADQKEIICEIYPLVLESQVIYPKSAARSMPYYLGELFSFSQTTEVKLLEKWNVNNENVKIEGDGFVYESIIKSVGNSVFVTHNYELNKDHIAVSSLNTFQDQHREILNQLSYRLHYNPLLDGYKLSWITSLIAMLTLIGGIFASIIIFKKYDPAAWRFSENKPIGGWLILPAIGITITPFVFLREIFLLDHFNHNLWESYFQYDIDFSIILLFIGEIIFNFLFLIFSVLILILFYKRRTSLPRLITIFYLVALIGPVIDYSLGDYMGIESTAEEEDAFYKQMTKSLIAAIIWIPYFNISDRVKHTFCKSNSKTINEEPEARAVESRVEGEESNLI